MRTLKEQNGKYYQQCQVVMLKIPTGAAIPGQLALQHINDEPDLVTIVKPIKDGYIKYYTPQHLYILSNEEIKEGDYVVSTYDRWEGTSGLKPQLGKIISIHDDYYLIDSFNGDTNNKWDKGHSKKIIATTDDSLRMYIKPSQKFIKVYIEQYNAGNQITDVLVEYDTTTDFAYEFKQSLKIDSDNTITIKKVQDSYSREEVINLCQFAFNAGRRVELKAVDKEFTFNNWIKENL